MSVVAIVCEHGEVVGRSDPGAAREETPVIKELELRLTAQTGPATPLEPGPSHESDLPRRPPCHWLEPPRVSVESALLPWRAPSGGRIGSNRTTDGSAETGLDRRDRPSKRKQKL
jgi:hypothetical protein